MRLIDADKIISWYSETHGTGSATLSNLPFLQEIIENMPAVDAKPVIHAHWIKETKNIFIFTHINYKCSNCNQYASEYGNLFPRCPHCGAEMDDEII